MEEWKLQVSYKTPAGDMINIRSNTADELSVLLEGIGDYSTQIAAVQKLVVGAYNLAPLGTTPSTQGTMQSTSFAPTQGQGPSLTPPPSAVTPTAEASGGLAEETVHDRYGNVWVYNKPGAPTCIRGTMVLKSAVSQAGKAYKCYSDPAAGPKWSGEKIAKEQHAPIIWA